MHVAKLDIRNIRSIERLTLTLDEGERAGWHVILGANGAGKSSVVRALALALAGPKEAAALRQDWSTWLREGAGEGGVHLSVIHHPQDRFMSKGRPTNSIDAEVRLTKADAAAMQPVQLESATKRHDVVWRSLWGASGGWFCASFGPFRRFSGGNRDFERLFFTNPRVAPHLSAFGEDVALTEGLQWLQDLRIRSLEGQGTGLLDRLIAFLNASELLPHGATIHEVKATAVVVVDGEGTSVAIDQMSDGYRSVLSMIIEIFRQMAAAYGDDVLTAAIELDPPRVSLPGVVAIDEVDAHLHPSWQRDIGPWFVRCFPDVQFIVTTHSPIICRTATSVWRLATPGTDEEGGRIGGAALDRLIHGSIIDAYGTEFFGRDVARSAESKALLGELATLNRKSLRGALAGPDAERLTELRAMFPSTASRTADV